MKRGERGARLGRRALRSGLAALGIVCAAAALAILAGYLLLRASLPRLDGRLVQSGLAASVTIERDALGVVTITAANRTDLAFATGFAHAQDRFFQMDLARRLAAGELSELVGRAALEQDLRTRRFRFRAVARRVLALATREQRALLKAYTRGVNAGLASLGSRPWEYWLLRARPAPWRSEDSILVGYAMWWQLQSGDFARERGRREIDARLGGPVCAGGWKCALEFLYPSRTAWDAPNVTDEAALAAEDARDAVPPAIPGPDEVDLRGRGASRAADSAGGAGAGGMDNGAGTVDGGAGGADSGEPADIGSNGWAIAGRLTGSGAALVASDMHLPLGMPPTWYRVRLRMPSLDLNGLTLPGTPVLVAGSNGHIAWALTNSDGDWVDMRPLTCLGADDSNLRTPDGDIPLSTVVEHIGVRGGADVLLPVRSIARSAQVALGARAPFGTAPALLLEADPAAHRCWIGSWVAESPGATNLNLLALEHATSVTETLALAAGMGIPEQNIVVGDSTGHIGWAIAGRIPAPSSDVAGSTPAVPLGNASPWLGGDAAPHLNDPPIGRVWTANARPIEDPTSLAEIGGDDASVGAHYVLGARGRQIRDSLLGLAGAANPRDMLHIQLDDRAIFLTRWRDLMLELLDARTVAGRPARAQMRRLLAAWDARADVDSVGYRLVRVFHDRTENAAWAMILRSLGIDSAAPDENDAPPVPLQFERALWTLVTRQPLNWLGAAYPSWRAFLLDEIDATAASLARRCGGLARCRWGAAHPVHIRHPLSRAIPFLSRLIDLPTLELPGDHDMPRVQDGAFGASERFAVSPGHEAQGYLELPGGQCDHPLSPYFRAGFRAWALGEPAAFLPGPVEHRLVLQAGGER
ncbi:MAG: penicillin acylase family protein [Steroidobacteraceae bacterium]